MKVNWDYTDLAESYDKRPGYSDSAIKEMIMTMGMAHGNNVLDLGAGTGKLTRPLSVFGLNITAIEPNDAMLSFGKKNTHNKDNVKWVKAAAEDLPIDDNTVDAVFMGSSFNVVDQQKCLKEIYRVLKPKGRFACMWNHRDLRDTVQIKIENCIKSHIPDYNYGTRRQDPTDEIMSSNLFDSLTNIDRHFSVQISAHDFLEAWKSHGTLHRQAGASFSKIIEEIIQITGTVSELTVPYDTRIWVCRSKK